VAVAVAGRDADAAAEVEHAMNFRSKAVAVCLLPLGLSACVSGPNYQKPDVPEPAVIRGAESAPPGPSLGEAAWWDVFQDEQLQSLIRTALKENDDVRIAAARVLQAEARVGITRADQYPSVALEAGAGGTRTPRAGDNEPRTAGAVRIGGSVAWELDFWGRYRRATESARATLLATDWGRRAVIGTVLSQVADSYFALRAFDLQLEIARRTLTTREESLKLTQAREAGGVTSLLDVREAEQLVFGARASIAELERRIAQEENRISLLLGAMPAPVGRGRALIDQPHPPEIPAGLSSALLERRPDVQSAEQQIVAENAQIGVARAAYFPSIPLTGSGGLQSSALGALFSGGAVFWSAAASAVQPVFTAGRTRSQVALAEARTEEAKLVYAQTVKQAFREAADALVGYAKAREFRGHQEQLTTAAQDARRLADVRYQGGATSYLEVLDADTRLFVAELTLAGGRQSELSAFVEVYRALGGGWGQEGSPSR
jgi:multidrug efflux system outer membrane protein